MRPQRQPAGFDAEAAQARAWAIDYWQRAAMLEKLNAPLRARSERNAVNLMRGVA